MREPAISDPTKTQTDAVLAAAEKRYAMDPERAEIIARTRRFKSSWIELAESLSSCREQKQYQAWGYSSFEDYYKRELHLRQATVDKLVGSYAFLHRSAPNILRRDGLESNIPSYQSIDFLRRAEQAFEEGLTDEKTIHEVRQAVLEETAPLPKISRLFRKTLFPEENEQEHQKKLGETEKLARRLSEVIASLKDSLPTQVTGLLEEAIQKLLQALPKNSTDNDTDENTT